MVTDKRRDLSGKGINVSIVLEQLGEKSLALGLIFDKDHGYMMDELSKLSIEYKGITVHGNLRENIKLLDENQMVTTEFNQKGEFVSEERVNSFISLLERYLPRMTMLVVDGSVPKGVDQKIYYDIIQKANELGVTTLLDADGELFIEGLKAKPTIIKPNLYELKIAFGLKDENIESVIKICQNIINDGVEIVCVSMGERGALIINKDEAYFCSPSKVDVISTQGAGDSMVAGLCMAYLKKLSLKEMLRFGVAAAQGSLIREGTLLCEKKDFEHFYSELKIETITSVI